MTKVYITDYIEDPHLEREILKGSLCDSPSSDVEVLIVWHQLINAKYLSQFPNLRGVVRYGVGFDGVDLEEIKNRRLVFCNTPDYGTDEVSDTALAMMLSLLRGVFAYNFMCKNYFDNSWQENTIPELRRVSSLVLGVIGAGRIGTALMRKAKVLGMSVVFYDPYKESGYEKAIGVSRSYDLADFLKQSDVVSLHTPLTSETLAMVDEDFINRMRPGSILINCSRGEVVKDLVIIYEALKSKQLSSVALDVLPDEPPLSCSLINAWRASESEFSHRIIINPHTSYYTQESYTEMRVKSAENAMRIINGIEPLNVIVDGR